MFSILRGDKNRGKLSRIEPVKVPCEIVTNETAVIKPARQIKDLTDQELKTLWFVVDEHLDTTTLGEIYCELKVRGIHVHVSASVEKGSFQANLIAPRPEAPQLGWTHEWSGREEEQYVLPVSVS